MTVSVVFIRPSRCYYHYKQTNLKDIRIVHFNIKKYRTHPYFISKEAYAELIDDTKVMNKVTAADWVRETIASGRHTIFKGIKDPRGFIFKPKTYIKTLRDAYCIERMHRAFKRGLMEYGMLTATKKKE